MTEAGRLIASRIQMLEDQLLALEPTNAADLQIIVYRIASLLMRVTLRFKMY